MSQNSASAAENRRPLTVDVHVPADVRAAKSVGDLAGDGFCEEGVVHDDLVCGTGDLLDDTSSFGPPGERIIRHRGQNGEKQERQRLTS